MHEDRKGKGQFEQNEPKICSCSNHLRSFRLSSVCWPFLLNGLDAVICFLLLMKNGVIFKSSEQDGSPQLAAKAAFSSVAIRTGIRNVRTSCRRV